MTVFALCDANNFYCSCERAFDPRLKGKPVVVLSNNDGCCIARSQEAKDLGIKMGDPWHKIASWAEAKGVRKFSSNYELYGDMSRRIFEVLSRYSPEVEPYSIDEMFLDLGGLSVDLVEYCQAARSAIRQETGIPCCIGIAETKTKAKLANHVAKKRPEFAGVCDLRDPDACRTLYPSIPVSEVWGIGPAATEKLAGMDVSTVDQLAELDLTETRDALTVTGARVVMELRGVSCLPMTLIAPQRKGTAVTRTFGKYVTEWDELAEAVSAFATRAAEKLREHRLLANTMTVFIQTNRFGKDPWYSNSTTFGIEPSADTFALIADALRGLRSVWRPGLRYWKAGVMLNDLFAADQYAGDLFATRDRVKSQKLMAMMDGINKRHGRNAIRPAVTGIARGWTAKAGYHSPRYTTKLGEIMRVDPI